MTTYTSIPNSSLEPGKPIRSIDGLALRDNPLAIAEGDASAPKIQTAAIQDGAITLAKFASGAVLSASAQATAGSVGSYAFLYCATLTSFGTTRAGSALYPVGSIRGIGSAGSPTVGSGWAIAVGSSQSGTWRCMGQTSSDSDSHGNAISSHSSLWLRIS